MAKKDSGDEDLGIQVAVLRTKVYEGVAKQLETVVKSLSDLDKVVDKLGTKVALIEQSIANIKEDIDKWNNQKQTMIKIKDSTDRKGKWMIIAACISVSGAIIAAVIALL